MQATTGGVLPLRVRKIGTREVVPRTEYPNLRDHGRTVDARLLRMLGNLQKTHGEAFASEAGLRRMFCEDTGHMPGLDTIRRALERLERQGVLEQVWLRRGGILPDGRECSAGTRLVWLPQGRRHRRAMRARAGREGVTRRVDRRALATLQEARAGIAQQVATTNARQDEAERRRREGLKGLAELEAQWSREGSPAKPPD